MKATHEEIQKLESKATELRKIIKNKERQLTGISNKLRKIREAKSVEFSESLDLSDYTNFGKVEWDYLLYNWHDSTDNDYKVKGDFWGVYGMMSEGINEYNTTNNPEKRGTVKQHLFGIHSLDAFEKFMKLYPLFRKYLKTQETPINYKSLDKTDDVQVVPVKLYFNIFNWYWMTDGVHMELDPINDKARLCNYYSGHDNTKDWQSIDELFETLKTKSHGDYDECECGF